MLRLESSPTATEHIEPVLHAIPTAFPVQYVGQLDIVQELHEVLVGYFLALHCVDCVRVNDLISKCAESHIRFLKFKRGPYDRTAQVGKRESEGSPVECKRACPVPVSLPGRQTTATTTKNKDGIDVLLTSFGSSGIPRRAFGTKTTFRTRSGRTQAHSCLI